MREVDAALRARVLDRTWTGPAGSGSEHLLLRSAALLGQRGVTLPLLLAAAVWRTSRTRSLRPLLTVLAGLFLLAVTGAALKYGLGRPAPGSGADGLNLGGRSYPSGHTANAVLTGGLPIRLLRPPPGPGRIALISTRRSRSVGVAAGLVAGAGVVGLDYHWASDVLAGLLLGLGLLALLETNPSGQAQAAPHADQDPLTAAKA